MIMKILVDTGVVGGSNFLEPDSQEQQLKWRGGTMRVTIAGFKRTEPADDPDQQREKDALFTIGRLARSGRIALYSYCELHSEDWRRGKGNIHLVNALGQCKFQQCPAAIERSKFRQTSNMNEWIAKGGKADKRNGLMLSDFNQIPYFEWLASLTPEQAVALVYRGGILHLDDFEVSSVLDLPWFQSLSRALATSENLPDCFHIWTARRNGLDVFLTLEKKLPRMIEQLKNRREKVIDMNVAVLRPTDLLHLLDVSETDRVPVSPGRFYSLGEICEINRELLKG